MMNVILVDGPSTLRGIAFFDLCLLQLVVGAAGGAAIGLLGQDAIYGLRMDISRSIVALPLRKVEELGPGKLLAALTDDVLVLSRGGYMLSLAVSQVGFILASMAYLAWLSPTALLVVVPVVSLSVVAARLLGKRATVLLGEARDQQDTLHKGFHGITSGSKELKLHAAKLNDFVAQMIEAPGRIYMDKQRISAAVSLVGSQAASFLFLLLVGVLLFTAPTVHLVPARNLVKYVLGILTVLATVEAFLRTYPLLLQSDVAVGRLEKLGLVVKEQAEATEVPTLNACRTIELRGVVHEYRREQDDGVFAMGPIDLLLRAGEVVFIVGGNGSGKSTLVKVLTGLYPPLRGEIRLDGRVVDDDLRPAYRSLFSAVFSDFYLFDKLHGLDPQRVAADAGRYLAELRLDKKVSIQDGAFSTSKLSQGQRKRLMLLTAYLEDRPVYVFDEWASDQDPIFKDVFYRQILRDLKARGKTVVVVSHDDRYFGLADRLVALEDGHLTNRLVLSSEALPPRAPLAATAR